MSTPTKRVQRKLKNSDAYVYGTQHGEAVNGYIWVIQDPGSVLDSQYPQTYHEGQWEDYVEPEVWYAVIAVNRKDVVDANLYVSSGSFATREETDKWGKTAQDRQETDSPFWTYVGAFPSAPGLRMAGFPLTTYSKWNRDRG